MRAPALTPAPRVALPASDLGGQPEQPEQPERAESDGSRPGEPASTGGGPAVPTVSGAGLADRDDRTQGRGQVDAGCGEPGRHTLVHNGSGHVVGGSAGVGFVDAMAGLAAAVAVAAAVDESGVPCGVTVSSLSSLSLDPPLVLFCLARASSSHATFTTARRFAVSVLGAGQAGVARRVAGPAAGRNSVRWGWTDRLPVVPGGLVHLLCTTYDQLDGGDHTILIGRVDSAATRPGAPLVYHQRSFHRLGAPVART
jgi:flavin reductase ActVB